jgi:hypothetical protein
MPGMNTGNCNARRRGGFALSLALVSGLVLLLHAPRWVLGRVCFPNDLYIHFNWTTFYVHRWLAGCWKPEWLPEVFNGLGAPVFAYYPPGYFAVTGLVQMLIRNTWLAMRLVEAGAIFAIGCIAWMYGARNGTESGKTDRWLWLAALCASPYAMAQLSLTGTLPSFVSGVLVLYMLVRGERVLREGTGCLDVPLAVAAGLIPWIHNLALMMGLASLSGGLLLSAAVGQRRGVKAVILSVLTGVVLGSGHLFSAFAGAKAINMSNLVAILDWRSGFAVPIFSTVDWFVFQWVIGGLFMAGVALLAAVWWSLGRERRNPSQAYWFGAAAVPMVLATELSWPVWASLPLLQHFQFPTRFFQPASLSLLMGIAGVLSETGVGRGSRRRRGAARLFLLASLGLSLMLSVKTLRDGEKVQSRLASFLKATSGQWEYLPAGQPRGWQLVPEIEPGRSLDLDGARIDVQEPNSCGGLRADVRKADDGLQRLPVLAHPRWRVLVDGGPTDWTMHLDSGLVQLRLPAGRHRVEFQWRREGMHWLSLAGLAILCAGLPVASWACHRHAGDARKGEATDE